MRTARTLIMLTALLISISAASALDVSDYLIGFGGNETTSCTENWNASASNLTANGAAACATSGTMNPGGSAIELATSNTNYFSGSLSNLPTGSTDRTICAWFDTDSIAGYGHIANWGSGNPTPSRAFGWYRDTTTPTFYGFSNDLAFSTSTLGIGTFSFLCSTYDGTNVTNYFDATRKNSAAKTLNTVGTTMRFGVDVAVAAANLGDGTLDMVIVYGRVLNQTEIDYLYNSGNGCDKSCVDGSAPPPPTAGYISLTAINAYDATSITAFNASLTNTSGTYDFSTTNGTINTGIDDTTGPYNITINAADYFTNTTSDVDVSSGSVQFSLAQAYVSFSCYEQHTNNSLNCSQPGPYPRTAGSYTDQINVTGYHPVDYSYSLSALENETFNVTGFYDHKLNITADDYAGDPLSNFTITYNSTSAGISGNESDNNEGSVQLELLQGYNYTVQITQNVPEGADLNASIETVTISVPESSPATTEYYQFNLTFPSLTVYVYDEDTGVLVPLNTTLTFSTGGTSFDKTITNGTGVFNASDSIPSGTYAVTFNNDDYSERVYNLTYNRTYPQTLTAYLVNISAPSTTFTLQDIETREIIAGATTTIQRFVNGTLTTISVLESDITGRIAFDYLEGTEYRFTITITGYETKNFTLNPINFPTYTILLQRTSSGNPNTDPFSGVNWYFNTTTFREGETNSLRASVSDPSGGLVSYGYNVTVTGQPTTSATDTNAYGSTLETSFIIPSGANNATVTLAYYYQLSNGQSYRFVRTYTIEQVLDYPNQTWSGNRELAQAIPPLDRAAVVVIATGTIAALAYTFTGVIGAAAGSLALLSFFTYVGFINGWILALTFIGLVLISLGGRTN